jgi:hypothetical protein
MGRFIFYTDEGYTISPNDTELESLQILGFEKAKNLNEGKQILLENNPWINESGFKIETIKSDLILDKNSLNDIKSLIDYLYENEKKKYEESNEPEDHIFLKLERLKKLVQ